MWAGHCKWRWRGRQLGGEIWKGKGKTVTSRCSYGCIARGDKQVWHEREMRQVLADCWGDSEAEGAWQVCGGRRPPSCNTPHLETLHYLHFTIYTESSTSLHARVVGLTMSGGIVHLPPKHHLDTHSNILLPYNRPAPIYLGVTWSNATIYQ